MKLLTSLIVAAIAMIGGYTFGTLSETIEVNTSLSQNMRWMAVKTNEVSLVWDWNTDATSARLQIAGMKTSITTNFTTVTSNYLWQAFFDVPSEEDVFDLTLTFFDNSEVVVGVLTSKLAVVLDCFTSSIPVDTNPDSAAWSEVRGAVVIPYDSAWSNETMNSENSQILIDNGGLVQTNTFAYGSGYFGWYPRSGDFGFKEYDLMLTFPPNTDVEWNATLTYMTMGTLILIN
jgi:hypothetical protein